MEPQPAVVAPLDEHMGLDIARSLARQGIPVYGLDHDPATPGRYSRRCRFVQSPCLGRDGEVAYLQFLLEFGRRLGRRSVLYPLSDAHVLFASRHRARLREWYEYVMPEHGVVERLLTKDGLAGVAAECGVPAPRTVIVRDPNEIAATAAGITYPVILKPTESTFWHDPAITKMLRRGLLAGRAKVVLCNTPAELLRAYERLAACDGRLVVQEVIPGEDGRLAYIAFYLDRRSRPLGLLAGRKHRVLPTGFGSASYVRSCRDSELEQLALKMLAATRYQGLGGIEFKRDPRDGLYKLIEANVRFGMWDGLGVRCGVDLPYIAYRDALGLPQEPQLECRTGVIWVDGQRDLRAAIEYRRRGELSLGQWLRSLRGEKVWAIYSADDWRPGVAFTLRLFARFWERLRHRNRV